MTNRYIHSMTGYIQKAEGYGQNGFTLVVIVSFDSKQFSAIKKQKSDPLATGMGQIKNVVFEATGVRSSPGYSRPSMNQQFPRASRGLVILKLSFDISELKAKELGADTKQWGLCHTIDLNKTLEATKNDGHLFAKTALAAVMGH